MQATVAGKPAMEDNPPMKIGVIGSGTASRDLPGHIAELSRDDVQSQIVNPRLSAFAATPYERLVVDLGYVDAAQAAAADGCDALFINSMADYGLDAMRAAVGIPVVGAGEAALRDGARGGRRFAIVTVWPASMRFLYDERLRACGLESQCVAIRHLSGEDELGRLGADDGVMSRMHRGERAVVARLAAMCEDAVREDGAECIVLGCTCMAPVGPAVASACFVPVIESSRAGFLATVAAGRDPARRAAATGPRRSTRTALVPGLVDAWLGASKGGAALAPVAAAPDDDGDCPVCIVAPD
jgi:allantoin racemase